MIYSQNVTMYQKCVQNWGSGVVFSNRMSVILTSCQRNFSRNPRGSVLSIWSIIKAFQNTRLTGPATRRRNIGPRVASTAGGVEITYVLQVNEQAATVTNVRVFFSEHWIKISICANKHLTDDLL